MQSTLDKFGRVVIPKSVRDELHLTPGTALSVEERNGEVVLTPTWESPSVVRKGGLLLFAGEAVGDLLDAQAAQRRVRTKKAAAWPSG
jgi:AbrB family looped-hinge helix DNA binding protein